MKVGRHYIGKMCQIRWFDPINGNHECDKSELPKGKVALGVWRSNGVIDDLTDGVVRLIQADTGLSPVGILQEADACWIPEDLIDAIISYVPEVSP